MNPDSHRHDRVELPDNLKLLFRPVAMMLPDKSLIAEVILYSMGFRNARDLAKKIIETYQMCSEQLSSQYHYDYSLRAVKSVVSAGSKLKFAKPEEDDEYKIILKAMCQVNLPQFVGDDVTLFKGILADVFAVPEKKTSQGTRPNLINALTAKCKEKNLQATPWFLDKIVQLYEMAQIQHGIMVIGKPMSCKTMSYEVLCETLTSMNEVEGPEKQNM